MSEDSGKGGSLATDQRRGFLTKALAITCGGLAVLPSLAAAIWSVLDPLRRSAGVGDFVNVADLSNVPRNGLPRQFPVIADRVDAWTGFAAEPIGAVYIKLEEGSDAVKVLSATCPHAGCFVEIDSESECFRCPCHNSTFALDGSIVAPSPSPRPMDSLECKVDQAGGVLVRWQNFYTGIEKKVARP